MEQNLKLKIINRTTFREQRIYELIKLIFTKHVFFGNSVIKLFQLASYNGLRILLFYCEALVWYFTSRVISVEFISLFIHDGLAMCAVFLHYIHHNQNIFFGCLQQEREVRV